jgi:hypothetical protein
MRKGIAMTYSNASLALALAAAAALLPAATSRAASPAEAAPHVKPARVEPIAGTNLRRVTLTDRAAQRLDVKTADVREDPSGARVVPYSSIVYDNAGVPWIYTSPEPLVFVRRRVEVARIDGEDAHLKDGPPAGTRVAVIGVAQLYGAEKGIGH